jgi:hypothetical protein
MPAKISALASAISATDWKNAMWAGSTLVMTATSGWARRDRREKARCLEEREAAKDRDMQRQLDYDRQRLLQEEPVRKEIEEQRLYEEWKRQRLGS